MNKTDITNLQTLIVLSGDRRLPDLEKKIFLNFELRYIYLNHLCGKYIWYLNHKDAYSYNMCYYAIRILKERWLLAEPHLYTISVYKYYYQSHFDLLNIIDTN